MDIPAPALEPPPLPPWWPSQPMKMAAPDTGPYTYGTHQIWHVALDLAIKLYEIAGAPPHTNFDPGSDFNDADVVVANAMRFAALITNRPAPDVQLAHDADPMPVFVLKGKDALALATITFYREECASHGLVHQAHEVELAWREMIAWQQRHPERVKLPDHAPLCWCGKVGRDHD